MNTLRAFLHTLKSRCVGNTLAILVSYVVDFAFDVKYRTETRSWINLDNLSIGSDNRQHGEMYQPTLALPLDRLFRKLHLPNGTIWGLDFLVYHTMSPQFAQTNDLPRA